MFSAFLSLFLSSGVGSEMCVTVGASSSERLPGFVDAAEDPEGQLPVLREVDLTW